MPIYLFLNVSLSVRFSACQLFRGCSCLVIVVLSIGREGKGESERKKKKERKTGWLNRLGGQLSACSSTWSSVYIANTLLTNLLALQQLRWWDRRRRESYENPGTEQRHTLLLLLLLSLTTVFSCRRCWSFGTYWLLTDWLRKRSSRNTRTTLTSARRFHAVQYLVAASNDCAKLSICLLTWAVWRVAQWPIFVGVELVQTKLAHIICCSSRSQFSQAQLCQ